MAAAIVGFVWQWARGPKHIPTWAANLVFVVVACAVFWLASKDPLDLSSAEAIRSSVAKLVMWVASCVGLGTFSADSKVAPRTNAL